MIVIVHVGFSRARSDFAILSKIITSVEKRPFSHAYIRFVDPATNQELVYQAAHGMVNLMHLDNFEKESVRIKEYKLICAPERFLEFYTKAQKRLGIKYSISQLMWLGLKKILNIKKWPSWIYDKIKNGESEVICSEEAQMSFAMIEGYDFSNEYEIDQITPSELDMILLELGFEGTYYGS